MIRLIPGTERHHFPRQIDAMHRLRAKVFRDRLQWDVKVIDGLERDQFDGDNPLYLIAEDDDGGSVRGCMRLLPTLGPNMLTDVFPVLLPKNQPIPSATIWEGSRFAVDDGPRTVLSGNLIDRTTAELLCGMTEVGLGAGLEFIVIVLTLPVERLLKLAGCRCQRLGLPRRIGDVMTVASLLKVSDNLLSDLQVAGSITGSVLEPQASSS